MQPVKGEERVLGFCCLFSPLLDPAAASEEQSGFEMRNTQGLTLGLEGLWGDVMLFSHYSMVYFHGDVMHRNAVKPSATSSARENCSSTRSSVSTGRLIVGVCRGVKWAAGSAGGLGRFFGYFWAGRILFELGGYF